MIEINPEFNTGNQERLNLILAQIKVESTPTIVMSPIVVLILESRCPIIIGQSIIINSEVEIVKLSQGQVGYSIPVLKNFFHITYVENHGGIFGLCRSE